MKPEPWTRSRLQVFVMYWHMFVVYSGREPCFDDYDSFCRKVNIMSEVRIKTFRKYVAAKLGHWPSGLSSTVQMDMFQMAENMKKIEETLHPLERLKKTGLLHRFELYS